MRNIPGSSFVNNTAKHGKYLKRGVLYSLRHIKKTDKGFTYIFTTNGEEKEINFESPSQADNFLDNFKV